MYNSNTNGSMTNTTRRVIEYDECGGGLGRIAVADGGVVVVVVDVPCTPIFLVR
jgi:hypothetical protein